MVKNKKVETKKAPSGATKKDTGLSCKIYDTSGKISGQMELPKEIFGTKINQDLIDQAIRVYTTNQRHGTKKTKTRGEIHASKAKIWSQKGTGRARHGARSAPIFVGGGKAHGPKPQKFLLSMPKKMKRKALFSALSEKLKDDGILVILGFEKIEPKTKKMAQIIDNFSKVKIFSKEKKQLIILPEKVENLERAVKNLPNVSYEKAQNLNIWHVLANEKLLFFKNSIAKLEETFLKNTKVIKD